MVPICQRHRIPVDYRGKMVLSDYAAWKNLREQGHPSKPVTGCHKRPSLVALFLLPGDDNHDERDQGLVHLRESLGPGDERVDDELQSAD